MIKINFDGDKYIATISYSERDVVKRAGFIWDTNLKRFVTHEDRIAYRLREHMDEEAHQHNLKQLSLWPDDWTRPWPDLEWPNGKKPFQHQKEFAWWSLMRRNSYCAGEAGTGKTAAAIIMMNSKPGPSIVICPSFLRLNWYEEIKAWTTWARPPKIQIIEGQKAVIDETADIYILPKSLLHIDAIREQLLRKNYEWLHVDEAHEYKNEDAQSTKSIFGGSVKRNNRRKYWNGIATAAERVVCYSGTPLPNGRPIELYQILKSLSWHTIDYMSRHEFGLYYCNGYREEFGWNYSGESNLEELHNRINSDFMIVKKLKDCVDLPEVTPPRFLYLKDNRLDKHSKSEMKLLKTLSLAQIMKFESTREGVEVDHDNPLGNLSALRRTLGIRKIPQAVDIIEEIMQDLEELVVFCWHTEVIDQLAERLAKYEPIVIKGGTSSTKRHEQVKEFQSSKTRNLILANIKAAGVGLTLTKAARYLFVEPSWVPGENEQAIRRLNRITQERKVQGDFLVYPDSLDHLILNAHQRKDANINRVIKPKGENDESELEKILYG